ncbi:hypothetical protein Ae168Ps1_0184 [Pseudonocardia sp. Ae168_Ps1]|nr:hypothetical protein Ae168Ps1_0184 [Pseudonocardia sp. Ae168_Ps1]OLL88098.1 hypothetical protein Ae263Ps1_5153c [Pseudonocardia sp. Ae263_Ps1]OLL91876.1 hypothetical protein Ae356Ps1_1773 [Pseudonocardia sp. Ae356_Ps1]
MHVLGAPAPHGLLDPVPDAAADLVGPRGSRRDRRGRWALLGPCPPALPRPFRIDDHRDLLPP